MHRPKKCVRPRVLLGRNFKAHRKLPCQLKVTYKQVPGAPSTLVTYRGVENPQVTDDTFVPKVPDGYQRIKILRHATVIDPKLDEPAPAATDTAEPGTKQNK